MEIYVHSCSYVVEAIQVVAASPCSLKPVTDGSLRGNAPALAKERML
jgi:hypothetical protein